MRAMTAISSVWLFALFAAVVVSATAFAQVTTSPQVSLDLTNTVVGAVGSFIALLIAVIGFFMIRTLKSLETTVQKLNEKLDISNEKTASEIKALDREHRDRSHDIADDVQLVKQRQELTHALVEQYGKTLAHHDELLTDHEKRVVKLEFVWEK